MENRFKSQVSKIFQSTFNSCRPKNNSDVSDRHLSFLKTPHHRRLIDLFSPKPQPLSSTSSNLKPHLSRLGTTPYPGNTDRHTPHSVSPLHEKTSKRGRKKKPHHRKRRNIASFSSLTDNYYNNWWSSDEGDKSNGENSLFSRRSFSSESLESLRKTRGKRSGSGVGGCKDRGATDVVAVAKESSDPHEDFRASMVDMIVERGIFRVEELEKLVECFLSLNSEENHKVIFEVFAEIWETLISKSDLCKND
ncbi:unnamed protein product [Lactuca virosa]|uniref:Transcription repressor n=1 Tax=Lactuca virosa TaxID=75947 RepID=A0AAU9PHD4_9ASTR|nr:unnamed protein product [Lactuca virosa]